MLTEAKATERALDHLRGRAGPEGAKLIHQRTTFARVEDRPSMFHDVGDCWVVVFEWVFPNDRMVNYTPTVYVSASSGDVVDLPRP